MNEITKLDTVQHYCDLFGIEALHPLISIVDCDKMPPFVMDEDSTISMRSC